ncbi:MAG: nucleotidyl transferase AbiEii/AbiGii toxin family protein [Kofleriaceae bacterium]|nr:nucleotidyl transferase AbiEii/AbiGii toxin family protein [Kofleriaceae bacterium]MBP6837479.1 nucleotidyl transferase AbiEii/AbiGii toxin family protein [Kofleriaceae bacterium]MBP9205543.1 nucleotidyl transferase AbiEii/AbiGii toxin family protein [Kofleriaceae bacterium]
MQLGVLRAFFAREQGFYLTGGAALAGFHLAHRTTDDLDLFTTDPDAFARGPAVLAEVASHLGGTLASRQRAPRFARYVLTDPSAGGLVIDLVHEPSLDRAPERMRDGEMIVDPADEIFANKLTALVGRAEERDLIDVMFLEQSGRSLDHALELALRKDGGCTPATLAWLLSEVVIPDGARLPAGVSAAALRTYVEGLVVRLRARALPASR